jgi:hypothetical protein
MTPTIPSSESPGLAFLRAPPDIEPPDALWSRIETARARNVQRRTFLRIAGASAGTLGLALALWIGGHTINKPQTAGTIDWQARAQALELRLRLLGDNGLRGAATEETRAELVRIDLSLQSAYDRGGDEKELSPLWKRRSELLDTLIETREQRLALTRI